MAVDFPNSPYVGQAFTIADRSWTWNGNSWDSASPLTYAPLSGANFTGPITTGSTISSSTSISAPNLYSTNALINGGFDFWQRGTSGTITSTNVYMADRWSALCYAGGTMNWSQQAASTTSFNSTNCIRIQRPAAATNTATMNLSYSFETKDALQFRGKTVTLSFWARAGANYSPTGSKLSYQMVTGTGTDQNVWGYTGSSQVAATDFIISTSWQRFSTQVTLGTSFSELGIILYSQVTGTAGANDYYEIAEVQFEVGAVSTAFKRNSPSMQGEFASCQRFFQRLAPVGAGLADGLMNGHYWNTTSFYGVINFPKMRAIPSGFVSNYVTAFNVLSNGVARVSSNSGFSILSDSTIEFTITTAATTSGAAGWVRWNSGYYYMDLSAEL